MLACNQVILDFEREVERFLGLRILRKLQMGIDEIIERMDTVLRRAPIGLGNLSRIVGGDRIVPAAEQHVGM